MEKETVVDYAAVKFEVNDHDNKITMQLYNIYSDHLENKAFVKLITSGGDLTPKEMDSLLSTNVKLAYDTEWVDNFNTLNKFIQSSDPNTKIIKALDTIRRFITSCLVKNCTIDCIEHLASKPWIEEIMIDGLVYNTTTGRINRRIDEEFNTTTNKKEMMFNEMYDLISNKAEKAGVDFGIKYNDLYGIKFGGGDGNVRLHIMEGCLPPKLLYDLNLLSDCNIVFHNLSNISWLSKILYIFFNGKIILYKTNLIFFPEFVNGLQDVTEYVIKHPDEYVHHSPTEAEIIKLLEAKQKQKQRRQTPSEVAGEEE
jgi:hypothetical protein